MKPSYDYKNQAWMMNGVYLRCGHPESMDCRCYGKIHAGKTPEQAHENNLQEVRSEEVDAILKFIAE